LGIAFVVFTFYPPHLPVFQDPITEGYGLARFSITGSGYLFTT